MTEGIPFVKKIFLKRVFSSPAFVCLVFVALSGYYSVATPIFEASDELWHYPYIKNIADGNGLPVQIPGDKRNYWQQEGGQPPLYYWLGALTTFWIDTGDIGDLYWKNPHASIGIPNADGNKNMVIHTAGESFPYHGVPLAVHVVRLLSILMASGTVYVTYLLGRELFPRDRKVALGGAMVNALIPQFLFISGSINNDNLVTLLSSAALLLIIRALRHGLNTGRMISLSVLVGLASLSKLSGLGLLGLVVVAAVLDAARARSGLRLIQWVVPVAAGTLLISGWWYVRNWFLYGDFLGLSVWLKIAGERTDQPGIVQLLVSEFQGFRMSFWAVFGGFDLLADRYVYWIFDGLTIASLIGLAINAASRGNRRLPPSALILVSAAWVGILGVSLLRWTQMTLASQGRLLFPAISVIAIAFFLGIRSLVPERLVTVTTACVGLAMFSIAVAVPSRNIVPAYPGPETVLVKEVPSSIQPLNINFERKAELLGYTFSGSSFLPGEEIGVTLYWKCLSQFDENYSVFVHVFGKDNEPIGQSDSFPGSGAFATRLCKTGDVIVDRHRIALSASASSPSAARIEAGLYLLPGFDTLTATDERGQAIGSSPTIGRVKVASARKGSTSNASEIAGFGGKIALVGIDVQKSDIAPGSVLSGTLVWRADTAIQQDYTVFVQLVGRNGLIAQYDSQPVRGNYPTSMWEGGEVIDDPFQMIIGSDVKEGVYDLIAGLYDVNSGARLKVKDSTFVKLDQIAVRIAR